MAEQIFRQASFKGADFHIEDHSAEIGGRRTVTHEYAGRNLSYPEDLGGKARTFTINAYTLGSDYQEKRNALVKSCNSKGSGELVHPYLGTLNVVCTGCTVSESSQELRISKLALSFALAESENVKVTRVNQKERVKSSNYKFQKRTEEAFNARYSQSKVDSLPSWQKSKLNENLASISSALSVANTTINTTPNSMFNSFLNQVKKLPYASNTLDILEKIKRIAISINSNPLLAGSSALDLSNSVIDMTNRVTISQTIENAINTEYPSSSETKDDFDKINDAIEEELENASKNQEDEVFTALQNTRYPFVEHIKETVTNLPDIEKISVTETMPSLKIAYDVTGFALDAEAFNTRNSISNPNFVKGGKIYEILMGGDDE